MKKRELFLGLCGALLLLQSCNTNHPDADVVIETTYGDIAIELYDETPIHKENFIKLTQEGFFEDLLFHRVIEDFMIQGGDPESRDAEEGTLLGAGDVGYRLKNEIDYPKFFHHRGALAAARESTPENWMKESSGCQFYIVWGKPYSESELNHLVRDRNEKTTQARFTELYNQLSDRVAHLETQEDLTPLTLFTDSIRQVAKRELTEQDAYYTLTDSIKQVYLTEGGTPWLDKNYTVFGRVLSGMDVVDQIQRQACDKNDRPLEDIIMQIEIVK